MTTFDTEDRPEREDLERVLAESPEGLAEFLEGVHPADLAEWVEELEQHQISGIFKCLDLEDRAELLRFAEDTARQKLLEAISTEDLVAVVHELPSDEVVDLLALKDEAAAEQILRRVDFERAQGLRELATYDPETAGGLMTTEFVAVGHHSRVGDAIKEIRSEEGPAGEEELGVFVVDSVGRPVGFLSDRELLTTPIHTPIQEVMETDLITVGVSDDQEEVGQLVRKYSLSALPVVDAAGVLIGVISDEDAQEVLTEEVEEDILRIVGAAPEEHQTRLPVLVRVRHRIPLQALTVAGGLVTAYILDIALPDSGEVGKGDTLRYLPIIIGLAGNVGIQSSTILVRAFATGEVSREREPAVMSSEVLVGFLIGILCGITTMLVATLMEGGGTVAVQFASSLGAAIVVAVTWAAFLGCAVPMTCNRLGIDPAIVAGPFLITLSDISGAAIFVSVCYMLMGG